MCVRVCISAGISNVSHSLSALLDWNLKTHIYINMKALCACVYKYFKKKIYLRVYIYPWDSQTFRFVLPLGAPGLEPEDAYVYMCIYMCVYKHICRCVHMYICIYMCTYISH